MLLRATIENSDRRLLPDEFVEVRLWTKQIEDAMFVPEGVVQQRQIGDTVLVVDENDTVDIRKVQLGKVFDHLQFIVSGLEPGDRVITEKILQARPGMKVKPIVTPWKDPDETESVVKETAVASADDGQDTETEQ